MLRIAAILLVVLVGAAIGYVQLSTQTLDPREAIDEGIRNAKMSAELSTEDEQLLRVQLALFDFIQRYGQPPETLSSLIPEYFDSLPRNPRTKQPFEYTRKGNTFDIGTQIAAEKDAGDKTGKLSGVAAKDTTATLEFVNPNTMEFENFAYDSTGKRDPFRKFDFSVKLDIDENLSPLQQMGLGQIRLTAVLNTAVGDQVAIVEDQTGRGYTIRKGTRIGLNNGVVAEIEHDRIKVLETTTDFTGALKQTTQEVLIQKTTTDRPKKSSARSRR